MKTDSIKNNLKLVFRGGVSTLNIIKRANATVLAGVCMCSNLCAIAEPKYNHRNIIIKKENKPDFLGYLATAGVSFVIGAVSGSLIWSKLNTKKGKETITNNNSATKIENISQTYTDNNLATKIENISQTYIDELGDYYNGKSILQIFSELIKKILIHLTSCSTIRTKFSLDSSDNNENLSVITNFEYISIDIDGNGKYVPLNKKALDNLIKKYNIGCDADTLQNLCLSACYMCALKLKEKELLTKHNEIISDISSNTNTPKQNVEDKTNPLLDLTPKQKQDPLAEIELNLHKTIELLYESLIYSVENTIYYSSQVNSIPSSIMKKLKIKGSFVQYFKEYKEDLELYKKEELNESELKNLFCNMMRLINHRIKDFSNDNLKDVKDENLQALIKESIIMCNLQYCLGDYLFNSWCLLEENSLLTESVKRKIKDDVSEIVKLLLESLIYSIENAIYCCEKNDDFSDNNLVQSLKKYEAELSRNQAKVSLDQENLSKLTYGHLVNVITNNNMPNSNDFDNFKNVEDETLRVLGKELTTIYNLENCLKSYLYDLYVIVSK